MNKSFIDEFNIEEKTNHYESINDYEAFSNKEFQIRNY